MSLRRTASIRLSMAAGVALTGGLLTTLAASPAGAAASTMTIRSAINPTLTAAGHSGLLLTVQRWRSGADNTLYAASSRNATAFGRPVAIGRIGKDVTTPAVALNGSGRGAIAWGDERNGGATMVRLRAANGGWAPAWRVPRSSGYVSQLDAAVNGHGSVAVLATGRNDSTILATQAPGGSWRVRRLPAVVAMAHSVAVGPHGDIWVAGADAPRGGDGAAYAGHMSPSGHWTAAVVGQEKHMVENASVRVDAAGRPYLIVGRVGGWASTLDTEAYWATRYVVLTKSRPTDSWHQVWNTDGATWLQSTVHGGQLRLAWVQYADADAHRYPQLLKLQTQVIAPTAGSTATLSSVPTSRARLADDNVDFDLAHGQAGCYGVAWRDRRGATTSVLHAWHNGTATSFADARKPDSYEVQGQIACTGTGSAYVARTTNQVVSGDTPTGGDVTVSRLP